MSDTVNEDTKTGAPEYEERAEGELGALVEQFAGGRPATYRGYSYVAQPAPGFDRHGVWHAFGTGHRTGYAAHAIAMHWLLHEHLGVPVELVPHRDMDIDIERFPKDRESMLMRWLRGTPVGVPELCVVSYPPDERMFDLAPRLAYYVAFEANRISKYTAAVCNDPRMTAIWCVSDFTARSYEAGGVDPSKLFVVRPPICDGPWAGKFSTSQPQNGDDFVFGVVGTWHARKGFHDLIRAYFDGFKRDEPVVLKLRTSLFGANKTIREFMDTVVSEIAAVAREFGDDDFPASKRMPRIRLEAGTNLTDDEMVAWLGGVDAYVNPSYGEGLGIPPIWAMAHGVPVISSTYGAVADFVNEVGARDVHALIPHFDIPVPLDMMSVSPIFERGLTWGGYNVCDLAGAMRATMRRGKRRDVETATLTRNAFSLRACEPGLRAAVDAAMAGSQWRPW